MLEYNSQYMLEYNSQYMLEYNSQYMLEYNSQYMKPCWSTTVSLCTPGHFAIQYI